MMIPAPRLMALSQSQQTDKICGVVANNYYRQILDNVQKESQLQMLDLFFLAPPSILL